MELRLERLSVVVNGRALVHELSIEADRGEIVGLLGPNGSGKTSALRCVYRALAPSGGTVWVDDQDLAGLSLRDSARKVAAMAQHGQSDLDFTVAEIVALGRTPHLNGNRSLSVTERELCRQAMSRLGVEHLAERGVLTLSGGERQRVLLARALVQQPEVLVLDEPTNHLDIRHQIELLSFLKDSGLTVLIVLHDLNLAAALCDKIGLLKAGELVAVGTPHQVLNRQTIHEVFEVDATVVEHPLTGKPQLLHSILSTADMKESP